MPKFLCVLRHVNQCGIKCHGLIIAGNIFSHFGCVTPRILIVDWSVTSSCKFSMRLPVHVGSKETWKSGACSAKEKGVWKTDRERKRQRKSKRRVTRDRERARARTRARERESCYRIGKRDTVVGRFGQGCWQGEPGLYPQIKKTGTSIDTAAIITGRARKDANRLSVRPTSHRRVLKTGALLVNQFQI